ncbi:MAG: glycosyltransferase family 39 protein [Ignavibacteria bacterium]
MGLRLSNRQLFSYGLVILLIGAAIGSVSLTYPYGRDQGIYAYAGKLLLEGKMNYRYVFDLKPPGIHFLFAFIQLIAGESMLGARFFDIAWQSFTGLFVFLIAFRFSRSKILSLTAAFLYIFLYFRLDYWHTLQTDGSLNLLFAVSVLLLISSYESHSFLKVFFAGILFSAALLIKYTIISFLPLLFICFLLSKKELFSLRIKNILAYSVGLLVPIASVILLYYLSNSLNELIDLQFVQTPLYTKIAYETESTKFITDHIVRLFTYSVYSPLILFSVIAIIIVIIKKKIDFVNMLLFSWIFSTIFSLIIQWKFYYYHFLVIIPPIVIGTVYGLSLIKENFKLRPAIYKPVFIICFFGFIAFGFKPYIENYSTLNDYVSGKKSLNDTYIKNGFTSDSVFMFSKTLKAVEQVKRDTNPDDGIFVWGFDPLIYYLSGRKCVSRFIYNFPLLWKAENRSFRREFMTEIETKNPKVIIVAKNDPLKFISGYDEDSKQLLQRFPEFNSLINSKYSYKTSVDDYEFYELKNW